MNFRKLQNDAYHILYKVVEEVITEMDIEVWNEEIIETITECYLHHYDYTCDPIFEDYPLESLANEYYNIDMQIFNEKIEDRLIER